MFSVSCCTLCESRTISLLDKSHRDTVQQRGATGLGGAGDGRGRLGRGRGHLVLVDGGLLLALRAGAGGVLVLLALLEERGADGATDVLLDLTRLVDELVVLKLVLLARELAEVDLGEALGALAAGPAGRDAELALERLELRVALRGRLGAEGGQRLDQLCLPDC